MIIDLPATTTSQVNSKLVHLREQGGANTIGRVLTLVIVTDDSEKTEDTIDAANYASREHPVPAKVAYQKKDMADWARSTGLAIKMLPTVFPVNSVKAMRGCILLDKQGKQVAFARAVFEIYWGEDKDISQDAVLTEVCQRVGVDPATLFAGIADQAIKDQLKKNTDEVMARGGFGSPTIFIDSTDMYFGNDRLPLVREALARRKASAA